MDKFPDAVRIVFSRWTVLNLAVGKQKKKKATNTKTKSNKTRKPNQQTQK